ncbi:MAG TPA: acyltransferase [Candidatus Saccharimonadales bacterium]|jgi:peptidoglycan/LPS O-acetylase OafA/YrhL|nr:acyltransferase [Candidatus Saccharimonadales bacterium]
MVLDLDAGYDPIVRSKMPELDTIRGTAIVLVLFFHGYYWSVGSTGLSGLEKVFVEITRSGWLGVNLFFVLSGFLITGILLDSKGEQHYFRDFYTRRALRILPAYYGILIILLLDGLKPRSFLVLSLLFLANVTSLFGVLAAYPVLWSLAVEEHFYLLWPTVVHKLSNRAVQRCAIVIVCFTPALRVASFFFGRVNGALTFTWLVTDGLAMGAWLAAYVRDPGLTRGKLAWVSAGTMGVALFILICGAPFGIMSRQSLVGTALMESCGDLAFLGLLAIFLLLGTSKWKFIVQRPLLSFYGNVSYGLYLIHMLVFEWYDRLVRAFRPQISDLTGHFGLITFRFVVCVAVSTGLASLSRRYFEGYFMRLRSHFLSSTDERTTATHPTNQLETIKGPVL